MRIIHLLIYIFRIRNNIFRVFFIFGVSKRLVFFNLVCLFFVKCLWQFQGISDNEKTRIIRLLKTGVKLEKYSILNIN